MAYVYMAPEGLQSPLQRNSYAGATQISAVRFQVVGPAVSNVLGSQQVSPSPVRYVAAPNLAAGRAQEPEVAQHGGRTLSSPVREPKIGSMAASDPSVGTQVADKFSHWPSSHTPAAAASVTSTAPSDDAESTPSQSENEHMPWSVDQTYRLCDAKDGDRILGRARLLDTSLASVATAVERLNQGVVFCPEDFCMVYSASSQAYFLLFRQGCREKAFAHFELLDGEGARGTPTPCSTSMHANFFDPGQGSSSTGSGTLGSALQTPRSHSPLDASRAALEKCSPGGHKDSKDSSRDLMIDNRRFRLIKLIGQGAFGVVWKALEQSGAGEGCVAAIKIMETGSQEDLSMAIFEADLLRLLRTQLPDSYRDQVPQYIAHNMAPHTRGGTVNLAMSFIPGAVLDQWLYGISDEEHKQVDIPEIVRGPLPGSRMHSMPLASACSFTANLLAQLAGVFAALQPIAFHRDISPHNVLIDIPAGTEATSAAGAPNFALIDFGLAVRSDTWQRDWNESNLAGDPRYWMPPAWMAFAFGFEHVSAHHNRSFLRQYLGRLDHYGLGVLGLEMLFALWDVENRFTEQRAPGMLEAREAWCEFWEAMFGLFQMFHMQGPEVTREHLERTTEGSTLHIAELLKSVQQTLRIAEADPANADRATLLHVLADLVDEHGVLEWPEIPEMFGVRREPEAEKAPAHHQPRKLEGLESAPQLSADAPRATPSQRAVSPGLPEVTRYEVVTGAAAAGVDRLSSTLQVLPSAMQPAPRSPKQERGVHLFTQSLPPQLTLGPAPGTPGPVSPSSHPPPTLMRAQPERPRSYVPPAVASPMAHASPAQPTTVQRGAAVGIQTRSYVPPAAIGLAGSGQAVTARVSLGAKAGLNSTIRCMRRLS